MSLTEEERGAGPVTELPDGAPLDVWLRFRLNTTVQELAVFVAYTDRARLVELTRRDGTTYRMWAGAVTNLQTRRPCSISHRLPHDANRCEPRWIRPSDKAKRPRGTDPRGRFTLPLRLLTQ
ncbi:hypothetical protein DEJ23_14845 [Curtobacterium sp. MCSS17_008]|nr:hypothetical protein DEJ23_14845 [Curtobacterium sp. MCSS17_008]